MGNSGGCLSEYWNDFNNSKLPRIQGGFVWDLVDQGLILPGSTDAKVKYGYGGDFGESPNSKQFCCNGMFGPDRLPHPTAFETAACQSPVKFQISQQQVISLTVINFRQFVDLSDLEITVSLKSNLSYLYSKDNSVKLSSILPVIGSRSEFELPLGDIYSVFKPLNGLSTHEDINDVYNSFQLDESLLSKAKDRYIIDNLIEVWLDITVQTNQETPWVPKHHTVLHCCLNDEILLEFIRKKYLLNAAVINKFSPSYQSNAVSCRQYNNELLIEWEDGSNAMISLVSGLLCSWRNKYSNSLMLESVNNCLWRAPTDNDKGGQQLSYLARWKVAGLRYLSTQANSLKLKSIVKDEHGNTIITISKVLVSSKPVDMMLPYGIEWQYTIFPDGAIKLKSTVNLPYHSPPLPRCGFYFAVPSEYECIKWFGLGPHESYDDRKVAVHLGQFEFESIESLHTPYVFPQENGRRADPRYFNISLYNFCCVLSVFSMKDGYHCEKAL